MDPTRSLAPRRPGTHQFLADRRVRAFVCTLLLFVLVIPPVHAQAPAGTDQTTASPAAYEDLLSASSWLIVSGHDPRFPIPFAGVASSPRGASPEADNDHSAPGAFSRNQLVTRQLGLTGVSADPVLAVDPHDSDHLVMAVNALDLPSIAVYSSADGGANWQGPTQAPFFPGDDGSAGSPALAFGRDGAVYLAALSISGGGDPLAPEGQFAVERSRISVTVSNDGGLTWEEPVTVAVAEREVSASADETGATRIESTTPFLDRPSLVVSTDPGHPEREVIAVAYTELTSQSSNAAGSPPLTESTIRLARSTDRGQSWSAPLAISPTVTQTTERMPSLAPNPGPGPTPGEPAPPQEPVAAPASPIVSTASGQVVQGAQLAALPDGALLAAYFDSTEDGPHQGLARVMIATSSDGGGTFSEPVQAGLFRELLRHPRTSFVHWWGSSFPRLAVGGAGAVAIAVTARPGAGLPDDADVLVLHSQDRGNTWDAPVMVSADEAGASQFFPALTFTPDDALITAWVDTGSDPSGVSYAIRAATSRDGGATWESVAAVESDEPAGQVSDAASNALAGFPSGQYLGDRMAIAAATNDIYLAWPDTRAAPAGAPGVQVAFARQRPLTEPAPSGDSESGGADSEAAES